MPKTVAPISHDAIKRSLKSKFKLILSENRILVETINGYVRKAEKVYKEMESTDDVTPKQFAKAMEKLERAYSACVRLIMVASDLFEKGDSDGMRTRDAGASSCESETSMYSSESSTTITDSNRGRKIPNDKSLQRRSKSSDVRTNDVTKVKAKSNIANLKNRTIELAEKSMIETPNTTSERLFVRPGSSSDFDHLIELQRFLHGLEKEKLQTDHPSPCIAVEKQLISCKIPNEKMSTLSNMEGDNRQASPEESLSQSLAQRLKILKSAIEHFKDRSLGDERVTQALNDIRELVLKSKDPVEKRLLAESIQDRDGKEAFNSQMSPISESFSTETRQDTEDKCCSKQERDMEAKTHKILGCETKCIASQQVNLRKSPEINLKLHEGNLDTTCHADMSPIPAERIHKISSVQQQQQQQQHSASDQLWMMEHQHELLNNQQNQNVDLPSQISPVSSPQVSDEDKEDINQIIVNKIVDMVSAKLAPRLQMKKIEDQTSYQFRGVKPSMNSGLEESKMFQKRCRSPAPFNCQAAQFTQGQHQGNFCGNYNHFPQLRRQQNYQPHMGMQQFDVEKLQRRQLRPKMVSFVEDYEDGSQYSTWSTRLQGDSRTYSRDDSPTSVSGTYAYDESERETERTHNFQSQHGSRFSSPNKKRTYTVQPVSNHRYSEQLQQQKQCNSSLIKTQANEDVDTIENDVDIDKDDDDEESDLANETDSETVRENPQYRSTDLQSKTTRSHESLAWVNKPVPGSPSYFDTEYRNVQQMKRGQLYQQQMVQKNESLAHRLPIRSPSIESHSTTPKEHRDKLWATAPQQPATPSPAEGSKVHPSVGDAVNVLQYRFVDAVPSQQMLDDIPEWQTSSADENVDCVHKSRSPKTIATHSQQTLESAHAIPTKAPRSTSSQPQLQHISGCYNNSTNHQYAFGKFKSPDSVFQTSESSCDPSPALSTVDRLQTDNLVDGHEDPEVSDHAASRPEVVCIDSLQLHSDASRTITLSNLPLDLEETELLNLFKKYGQVTKIYYIKDRNTGLFQGRAYGKFSKPSEAYQAAQDLQKLVIDGQEIFVQLYVSTP